MDTNEWVLLSDDGFFDVNENCDDKEILGKRNSDSKSVLDLDYFCTSPKSLHFQPKVPKQVVQFPIQLEPIIGKAPDEGLVEENTKYHVEATLVPSPPTTEKIKGEILEADLIKIKEIESPKSIGRGLLLFPSPDVGALKFEDKGEEQEIMASPRMKIEREVTILDCDKEVEDSSGGFNFWKWSLNGVGAICSFGVAAATICVLVFGSQQRNTIQQDQKIRCQIYSTDDKRIKQVVQHAIKLNGAISVVSGVPLSRAHITCSGYYDGI